MKRKPAGLHVNRVYASKDLLNFVCLTVNGAFNNSWKPARKETTNILSGILILKRNPQSRQVRHP